MLSAESAAALLPTGLRRLTVDLSGADDRAVQHTTLQAAQPPETSSIPVGSPGDEADGSLPAAARLRLLSPGLERLTVQDGCSLGGQRALAAVLSWALSGPTAQTLRELELVRCALTTEAAAEITAALRAVRGLGNHASIVWRGEEW